MSLQNANVSWHTILYKCTVKGGSCGTRQIWDTSDAVGHIETEKKKEKKSRAMATVPFAMQL